MLTFKNGALVQTIQANNREQRKKNSDRRRVWNSSIHLPIPNHIQSKWLLCVCHKITFYSSLTIQHFKYIDFDLNSAQNTIFEYNPNNFGKRWT